MNERILFDDLWIPVVLWIVLYISDYYLTLYGARLYQGGAKNHFVVEGSYELNPYFQQDIDGLRQVSLRFLLALLGTSLLLLFLRGLAEDWPWLFVFACGGMILLETAIHTRHIRNVVTFRQMKNGEGVKGKIEYNRWVGFRASAIDMGVFAGIFLALALIVGSWFCLGGAVSCAGLAVRHFLQSRQARKGENALHP